MPVSQRSQRYTVNIICGSGLKAIILAAQAIQCGDAEVIIAGGMENIVACPLLAAKARWGYRMSVNAKDDITT